ncbi:MAG: aminoglycoside adenylyltransferase domain-containing protein [Candidatus Limnocylindria bacterium]
MGGLPLHEVPETAQAAWSRLRDMLLPLLGDDLVAMWAHGGTTSISDPAHAGDLDTYVFVAQRPDPETARRIEEAQEAIAAEHDVDWDAWYVLVDDARGSDHPPHAWHEGRRDTSWAVQRAHWLAGRYVNLHGAEPHEIVTAPTWGELAAELDRELEHIERHVAEGDTDPYEATYAILNGSRILRSLATKDVVISKRAAGAWALEHLPARWHAALRAALRSYGGHGTAEDVDLLAAEMAPFVAFVRERLRAPTDRGADALPRWSGN